MLKIAIVTGSIRTGRVNRQVADFILEKSQARTQAQYEILDIIDFDLPLYAEPVPALFSSEYQNPQVKRWSQAVNQYDGFIFITPEYNRSITSAQKNSLDYLYKEWNNKAAGIVAYGSKNGVSAAAALRTVLGGLELATVSEQTGFNLFTDFKDMSVFTPSPVHEGSIQKLFDQVESWATALQAVRHKAA